MPTQRMYVATTVRIRALHDAMPEHLRAVILFGAFVGLRRNEIAALRVMDGGFMRGVVTPAIKYSEAPLKTEESNQPIPIPLELALDLNRMPATWRCDTIVVDEVGRRASPKLINEVFGEVRTKVEGLPEGFRVHDLWHSYASMRIVAGLDVKLVQARLRHKSAKKTLDLYGHLWPDSDESSRAAVAATYADRANTPADSLRTQTVELP